MSSKPWILAFVSLCKAFYSPHCGIHERWKMWMKIEKQIYACMTFANSTISRVSKTRIRIYTRKCLDLMIMIYDNQQKKKTWNWNGCRIRFLYRFNTGSEQILLGIKRVSTINTSICVHFPTVTFWVVQTKNIRFNANLSPLTGCTAKQYQLGFYTILRDADELDG